jgi:hypothetical protein
MLKVILEVDAPSGKAIGIKEDLAMYIERYGDCRVVSITEDAPVQMRLGEA